MNAVYHPRVQQDVSKALRHYDQISVRLGDDFWKELTTLLGKQQQIRFATGFILNPPTRLIRLLATKVPHVNVGKLQAMSAARIRTTFPLVRDTSLNPRL